MNQLTAHEQALRMLNAAGLANQKMLEGAGDLMLELASGIMQERSQAQQAMKQQEDAKKWAESQKAESTKQ